LTYEEFLDFTRIKECHYCGVEVIWSERKNSEQTQLRYNLDRKNNEICYTKDNCVVCCGNCNFGKSNRFTYEEWVVMSIALKEFRKIKSKAVAA